MLFLVLEVLALAKQLGYSPQALLATGQALPVVLRTMVWEVSFLGLFTFFSPQWKV